MDPAPDTPFADWLSALEQRHLSDLRFADVRRGLQALSRSYVERRGPRAAAPPRGALDGRGKRAAFALFYGPLHYLVVWHVVERLGLDSRSVTRVVDLGCGTGAAGAAWALRIAGPPAPRLLGVDRNAWAAAEARWSWRHLRLRGSARVGDVRGERLPGRGAGILAAWTINELAASVRDELFERLLATAAAGAAILVVEPIARGVAPWWGPWASAFERAGGRADEWRFPVELPDVLSRLDRAAGLDHRELTARTLCLRPRLTASGHGA